MLWTVPLRSWNLTYSLLTCSMGGGGLSLLTYGLAVPLLFTETIPWRHAVHPCPVPGRSTLHCFDRLLLEPGGETSVHLGCLFSSFPDFRKQRGWAIGSGLKETVPQTLCAFLPGCLLSRGRRSARVVPV